MNIVCLDMEGVVTPEIWIAFSEESGIPELRRTTREFLDELRKDGPVIILSDTFEQFAAPLIAKLGYPLLMCNTLEVAPDGEITGFTMRTKETKRSTVLALKSIGYDVIAFGDSYNDLGMILEARKGFFFRTTETLRKEYPEIPAYEEYNDLLDAIRAAY